MVLIEILCFQQTAACAHKKIKPLLFFACTLLHQVPSVGGFSEGGQNTGWIFEGWSLGYSPPEAIEHFVFISCIR